jgi:hypothetical protein
MKTLEAFEFDRSGVSAAQMRGLAEGEYVGKAEPVLLIGEAVPHPVSWTRGCTMRRV